MNYKAYELFVQLVDLICVYLPVIISRRSSNRTV